MLLTKQKPRPIVRTPIYAELAGPLPQLAHLRAANQPDYINYTKEQTDWIGSRVSKKWEKLKPGYRTGRKYRRIVECVKNAVSKTTTFTGPYQGAYNSRFTDGVNTGGGGGDLNAQQIYIGVPSFIAPNPTLTANSGFQPWPWDPRFKTYSEPAEWPSAESVGNYYIDNSHPQATDTANEYGYPDKPRLTRPTINATNVQPGCVMKFGGGTIDNSSYGFDFFGIAGTAENPIYVDFGLNVSESNRARFFGQPIRVENSSYIFIDGLRCDGQNAKNSVISTSYNGQGNNDHIVIRKPIVRNLDWIGGGSGIIGISADDRNGGNTTSDIVIIEPKAYDCAQNGDWVNQDQDQALIIVSARASEQAPGDPTKTSRVWVLGGEADNIGGNFIQIAGQGNSSVDHRERVQYVWAAGFAHGRSRQCAAWAKRSQHIIFSQVYTHTNLPYEGGNGQSFGCQYNPTDLWFLACRATNANYGIQQTGTDPEASPDEWGRVYCVGNILHDLGAYEYQTPPASNLLDQTGSFRPGTAFSFTSNGYMRRYVVLNTVYNCWNGIVAENINSECQSSSNIFSLRDGDYPNPVTGVNQGCFYQSAGQNVIRARNDQCYRQNGQWKSWVQGQTVLNVDDMNALTEFSNLLNSNPALADPGNLDFLPGVGSPVLNTGVWTTPDGTDVRAVFLAEYGLDIDFDYNQTERSATAPDRGAIEAA